MSAKDLIIDFLNLIFVLIVIAFCIMYFIAGDRVDVVTQVLKSLTPIGFFGLIFLFKLRKSRKEVKRREEENDTNIIIYLTAKDKFKTDLIIFGIPVMVLVISFAMGGVNKVDIIQALVVFILLSLWHSYIFNKKR